MLGMLMKYEWKSIWKKLLLFSGLLIGASIIGYLASMQFTNPGFDDATDLGAVFIGTFGFMLYYTGMIGVMLGFTLIVAIRFYKVVYGKLSYVTHTLPVSAPQIYGAHLIVYGLCMLVITLLSQVSIAVMADRLFVTAIQASGEMPFPQYTGPGYFYSQVIGLTGPLQALSMLFYFCIANVCSLLLIYASIVLGQYWKKYKVWGAVVSYLIISNVMTLVSCAILLPYLISTMISNAANDNFNPFTLLSGGFWWVAFAITAAFGVATFLIMDHGMRKRLNLQ